MDYSSLCFLNKPFIWMDPRSKLFIFLTVSFVSFRGLNLSMEIAFFSFILLLVFNGKQITFGFKIATIYTAMILLDIYIVPMLSGIMGVLLITLVRIFRIYLPIMMSFMLLIRTTTVSEFIAAFDRMRVSSKITIPFSVMFRFFPTVNEEWKAIRDAMSFRGIGISIKQAVIKPMATMEYVFVPLLMSCIKISGELSAASLSRGLDCNMKRTSITKIRFGVLDWFVVLMGAGFVICSLQCK